MLNTRKQARTRAKRHARVSRARYCPNVAESRAREAREWADVRRAREFQRRHVENVDLRAGNWPDSHDVTRGMEPHGTYRQTRASKDERALIRAWDRDEIRWNPHGRGHIYQMDGDDIITGHARGCTQIVPHVKAEEDVEPMLERADRPRAKDRRVWNTPGRNSGWDDAQVKAEKQFAYELRAQE